MRFEDENHADTYAVGKGLYTEHYLYWYFIVKPFLDLYEGKNLPIVNALYCYDNQDGQYFIICVNQALYFKDEEVVLMWTFRERSSGAVVNNITKQFGKNSPLYLSFLDQDISIQLLIKGTTPYIPLQTPTKAEGNSLPRFILTSPDGT